MVSKKVCVRVCEKVVGIGESRTTPTQRHRDRHCSAAVRRKRESLRKSEAANPVSRQEMEGRSSTAIPQTDGKIEI